MLGALQKFLASQAGNVGKLKEMPIEELVAMLGKKGKTLAMDTKNVIQAQPGPAAAIGLGGAGVGAAMSGGDEPADDEELLRAYGIR